MPANGELMINAYACFVLFCSLLTWLGCGADSSGAKQPESGRGGGGASAAYEGDDGESAASGRGGGGGSAGSRELTPPPEMPRELDGPDGIYCQSNFNDPPAQTCAAGSRCCPGTSASASENLEVCVADGGKCRPCASVTCAQLLCDGPEDCSGGTFCCYSRRTCKGKSEDCTAEAPAFEAAAFMTVECKARCVGNQRDPDHGAVVCKDDRDCPGRYVAGRCRPLMAGMLPYGIKICAEP